MSRRRLVGLSVAGALAGGVWTTGLGILARGIHPQFFVIGDDRWQLMLIEHGRHRALVCMGQMTGEAGNIIPGLMSSLRQHANVVAGTVEALSWASAISSRWDAVVRIQLDGSRLATSSDRHVHLEDHLEIRIGELHLSFLRLPRGDWHTAGNNEQSWIGYLRLGNLVIALAPSAEVAARVAQPGVALVIAPEGNLETLRAYLPGAAIVSNAPGSRSPESTGQEGNDAILVRTFPSESAHFRIRNGRIALPEWARSI